jgi:hypothetical protein
MCGGVRVKLSTFCGTMGTIKTSEFLSNADLKCLTLTVMSVSHSNVLLFWPYSKAFQCHLICFCGLDGCASDIHLPPSLEFNWVSVMYVSIPVWFVACLGLFLYDLRDTQASD